MKGDLLLMFITGVPTNSHVPFTVQVSEATGKVQLVDATGTLDVIVSDLRSFSNLHSVYQVSTRTGNLALC